MTDWCPEPLDPPIDRDYPDPDRHAVDDDPGDWYPDWDGPEDYEPNPYDGTYSEE